MQSIRWSLSRAISIYILAVITIAGPVVSIAADDPGGELVLRGDVEAHFTDLWWSVVDFSDTPRVKINGFDLHLYERETGRFKNAFALSGIPYDTPVNTVVTIGPKAGDGIVGAGFAVDRMNPAAKSYRAVSGTLTLTRHDTELAGEFMIQMNPRRAAQSTSKDAGLVVTGKFHGIQALKPTEN